MVTLIGVVLLLLGSAAIFGVLFALLTMHANHVDRKSSAHGKRG
jgi:hypothetical protein